jgi:hypothetical protein
VSSLCSSIATAGAQSSGGSVLTVILGSRMTRKTHAGSWPLLKQFGPFVQDLLNVSSCQQKVFFELC